MGQICSRGQVWRQMRTAVAFPISCLYQKRAKSTELPLERHGACLRCRATLPHTLQRQGPQAPFTPDPHPCTHCPGLVQVSPRPASSVSLQWADLSVPRAVLASSPVTVLIPSGCNKGEKVYICSQFRGTARHGGVAKASRNLKKLIILHPQLEASNELMHVSA